MLLFRFSPRSMRGVCNWLLLASLVLAGVPAYADLTTGLIAHYPFTGNAYDTSGNGYHGTVHGATLTTDRLGNANEAYSFDSSSYIDATVTSINTSNGAQVTLSFWMYWSGNDDAIPIGLYNYCGLWLKGGYFGFNTCNNDIYGISSAGLANRWVNVTAIFTNGSVTQGQIYIDGVARTTSQLQGTPDTNNSTVTQHLIINCVACNEPFIGKLDDIRIYNRAITAAEAQELYQISTPANTLDEALDNDLIWTTSGSANWFAQTAVTQDGIDAAKSGAITHSQSSILETTVTGPGELSFYWKVSSESGYDPLKFYMDNVLNTYISGTVDWQQKTFIIPEGSHSLVWVYSKDSTVSVGSDSGWVDQVIFTPANTLDEALDNDLIWTTSGSANWFAQTTVTQDGIDAAKSGAITHSQSSILETTVTGPGELSFYWKVSSESGYDPLKFYMDNVLNTYISGTVDWQQKTFIIPDGSHSLVWVYSKDGSVSVGSDAGWVDQVIFSSDGLPLVSTNDATNVTANRATLNGSVTPNGSDTTATFDFGTTTAYGDSIDATPNVISADASESSISADTTGLTCSTTYYYRVRAVNNVGITVGEGKSFTTDVCSTAPVVSTDNPSLITATSVILKGTVNPKNADTVVSFNFGLTTAYGQTLSATPYIIVATATATSVSAAKTGLTCGTTYHYRVTARNSAGTTNGADKSFTTSVCPRDLIVTNITLNPAKPVAGTAFSAVVTVKNQGSTATAASKLKLWPNLAIAPVCTTVAPKIVDVAAIIAGASVNVTVTGLTSSVVGSNIFRAFVDGTCIIGETNETNNQRILNYRIGGRLPDLVITNITLTPASPARNAIFNAAVTVKNQGTFLGTGFLDVWSNQATAATCGSVGNAWADVGVIAIGTSKVINVIGLNAGATAGAKILRAFVDSWCEEVESNEANNQLTKAYTVQ